MKFVVRWQRELAAVCPGRQRRERIVPAHRLVRVVERRAVVRKFHLPVGSRVRKKGLDLISYVVDRRNELRRIEEERAGAALCAFFGVAPHVHPHLPVPPRRESCTHVQALAFSRELDVTQAGGQLAHAAGGAGLDPSRRQAEIGAARAGERRSPGVGHVVGQLVVVYVQAVRSLSSSGRGQ